MSNYLNRDTLPPLVCEYMSELMIVKGKSRLTVNEYVSDLRVFFRFIESQRKNLISIEELPVDFDLSFMDTDYISKITLSDVNFFLIYCANERGNSVRTRARKAASIRGFFSFICDKMKYISENPVSQLTVAAPRKELPKYLTLEQSIALLQSVEGKNAVRDYCILTLFLNCGLRLSELVGLDLDDVNLTEATMVVTGKGNKQRMVYLNDSCVLALRAYLKFRMSAYKPKLDADKKALFLSRLNKRMGRQAVQLMVYAQLEKIGLKSNHYSVHKLRHTAATLMYQHANVDILVLKDMLGHENIATTEIYTHLESKQLREAVEKNPLNDPKIKKQ
ncbi:MAG: tyrosine recombinase XerC [Clostridia bacterium]